MAFPITTVFDNQQELLVAISTLHNEGRPFGADLSYGNGTFWTGVAETLKPPIRMDLSPVWKPFKKRADGAVDFDVLSEFTEVNLQADARALPFRSGSLQSVVADWPFIHAAGKDSIMGKRFGSYPSQVALARMYWTAGMEIQKALAPGGLLVHKLQDIVESGKQVWTHVSMMENYRTMGIPVIDLFILVRKGGSMAGWNHGRQLHARRTHSYFLVCRKESLFVKPRATVPNPNSAKAVHNGV